MFGPCWRTIADRLTAAAAWLRAFAFLEDVQCGSTLAAIQHDVRAPAAELLLAGHAHRLALRPDPRSRRPGGVIRKPMPCLTPIAASAAARRAGVAGRRPRPAASRCSAP